MFNAISKRFALVAAALALTACASVPTGPSLQSLPGRGKSFDQFTFDDSACRDFASGRSGGVNAADRANGAAVGSAAVGTAIGAGAGALLGGRNGAGVGAGFGLLTGALIGSDAAAGSYRGTQRQYDNAYHQCMYAKGNQVPVQGRLLSQGTGATAGRPVAAQAVRNVPPPNAPPPVAPMPYAPPPSPAISPATAQPPAFLPAGSVPPPNAPPPLPQ